jgi:hypothetical protein
MEKLLMLKEVMHIVTIVFQILTSLRPAKRSLYELESSWRERGGE